MNEKPTKAEMLDLTRVEFEALLAAIQAIDEDRLSEAGVEGDWSVKDTMSHISSWRRLMVEWIRDLLEGRDPNRPGPDESWDDLDDFNLAIFLANRDSPLESVLIEFQAAYREAFTLVESLTEEDLLDPQRFAWRKGYPLWQMVAGNTWLHDQEHRETIERWLEKKEA